MPGVRNAISAGDRSMLNRTALLMISAALVAAAPMVITISSRQALAETKAIASMSYRERQKACSTEWQQLKSAGKSADLRWPKFWSDCNARMKAKSA